MEQGGYMKYNKLAYMIYWNFDKKTRNDLWTEYDIERIDNWENKDWNNRFYLNFGNWLWMKKFKKHKDLWIPLMQKVQQLKNAQLKLMAEGPSKEDIRRYTERYTITKNKNLKRVIKNNK